MRSDSGDATETGPSTSDAAVLVEKDRRLFELPLFAAGERTPDTIQKMLPPPVERRSTPDALDAIRERIASRTGHDRTIVEQVVRALFDATAIALAESGALDLRPLGSFRTIARRERIGRHPRTGEPIRIPPHRTISFRVGKRLRERVDVPTEIARLIESGIASERPATASPPLAPPIGESPPAKRAKMIGIASGKGGTGKTFLAANLAVALALSGWKVAAVDADLGLANLHLLLGLHPGITLGQVVFEGARIETAIHRGPAGVDLVSGGAGATALADLKPAHLERLVAEVHSLRAGRDLVIVDSAAGLSPRTLRLMHASDLCLVATTPEVTAMTDAYAILKTIARMPDPRPRVALVVNQARSDADGARAHEKLRSVAEKFLGFPLELWALVPEDAEVGRSVARRSPLLLDSTRRGPAADAVRALADRIGAWAREA